VLDADPNQARARKPEYPLEFLRANRQAYLELSEIIGGITVIPPMSVQEVEHAVLGHALSQLLLKDNSRDNDEASASTDSGIEEAKLGESQIRLTTP
jgi:hypothetical protein